MKRIIAIILIFPILILSGNDLAVTKVVTDVLPEGEWEAHKSTHFIVYSHPEIPLDYVRNFSRKCEEYYKVITNRLGFTRENFWLWDDRAKVFIYQDREQYLKGTGRAEWSGGSVYIREKFMSTFYFEGDFFDVILPHELSHIILREFIGLKVEVPLWFEEGIACANEKDSLVRYLMVTKRIVAMDQFIEIRQLESISAGGVMVPKVFYPTAATVIIFLFENKKWGKDKFIDLCRRIREIKVFRGENFYGELKRVYGIEDAIDLNEKLMKYLEKQTYEEIADKQNFNINW